MARATVSVEHLNPAIEGKGLTVEQLQTDVELKLRLAGIRVASSNLSSNVKLPFGFLSVQVGVILGTNGVKETGRYAFALNIFFISPSGLYAILLLNLWPPHGRRMLLPSALISLVLAINDERRLAMLSINS
jgi:hypothetical protein